MANSEQEKYGQKIKERTNGIREELTKLAMKEKDEKNETKREIDADHVTERL